MTDKVPLVLQTEIAECGLACVAMIAQHFDFNVDLANLRRNFPISGRGSTLIDLVRISRALDFEADAFRVDLGRLQELSLPCILHWNFNHFVVLESIGKNSIRINDPAQGKVTVSIQEFSDRFTGIVLVLRPSPNFRPREATSTVSMSDLTGHIGGIKRSIALIIGLAAALEILSLLNPVFMQLVIDQIVLTDDRKLLLAAGLGFIALVFVNTTLTALRSWLIIASNLQMRYQWFINVFSHLIQLPLSYFERRQVGDIQSRFGSISSIQRIFGTAFIEAVLDGFFSLFALVVIFRYSVALGIVCVTISSFYAVLRMLAFNPIKVATGTLVAHAAKQESHFLETIRSARSIRLFGKEDQRQLVWQRLLSLQAAADADLQKKIAYFQVLSVLLFGAGRVFLIWIGAQAILDGNLTVGALVAAMFYAEQVTGRTASMIDKLIELRTLPVYIERLSDIVLAKKQKQQLGRQTSTQLNEVEFRNVIFRYSESDPVILDNISFKIRAGESVVFAGKSGCGKTTVLKLILGILEPTQGEIYFNGILRSRLSQQDLNRAVGVVMQDDALLSGSLTENISFFEPQVDQERLLESTKLANIYDEIAAFPMGFDTILGEMGTTLSGGQTQRVLLARALYKRPSIILLDEATSHLDDSNELTVSEAIRNLGMTRIIVAHRSTTIESAHRVIYIENGKIANAATESAPVPVTA